MLHLLQVNQTSDMLTIIIWISAPIFSTSCIYNFIHMIYHYEYIAMLNDTLNHHGIGTYEGNPSFHIEANISDSSHVS